MPRRTKPDAVALIKEDHRKVEGLFASFEKARDEDRKKALAREICTELTIHAMIEEEILYPACQGKIEDEEVLDEAYVEHDGAGADRRVHVEHQRPLLRGEGHRARG